MKIDFSKKFSLRKCVNYLKSLDEYDEEFHLAIRNRISDKKEVYYDDIPEYNYEYKRLLDEGKRIESCVIIDYPKDEYGDWIEDVNEWKKNNFLPARHVNLNIVIMYLNGIITNDDVVGGYAYQCTITELLMAKHRGADLTMEGDDKASLQDRIGYVLASIGLDTSVEIKYMHHIEKPTPYIHGVEHGANFKVCYDIKSVGVYGNVYGNPEDEWDTYEDDDSVSETDAKIQQLSNKVLKFIENVELIPEDVINEIYSIDYLCELTMLCQTYNMMLAKHMKKEDENND